MFLGRSVETQIANRVWFRAGQTYIAIATAIPFTQGYITVYNEITDPTGSFSGGTFTAPVAGYYDFRVWGSMNMPGAMPITVYKNTSPIGEWGAAEGSSWNNFYSGGLPWMDVGDIARVFVHNRPSSSNHIRYQFTGHLI